MTVRSNAEVKSMLPKYIVTPSDDFKEYLLVRCPRENCPSHNKDGTVRPFLVHKRVWTRPMKSVIKPGLIIHGRPCPYCASVSTIRR
jgi:hypothetical protein